MKFLLTGIFFGTLLVLWGLSLIIEAIFGITIPVLRIAFACMLIYAGLVLIKGLYESKDHKSIFFSQEEIKAEKNRTQHYKIVFGQGTLDLSDINTSTDVVGVQVYTLFGKAILKINPNVPTLVNATSIFSSVSLPDQTIISLGNYTYFSGENAQRPHVIIDATAVFSALEIKK